MRGRKTSAVCRLFLFLWQELCEVRSYPQLSYEQPYKLEVLNRSIFSQKSIGCAIEVSQSAISRELSRTQGKRG